MAAFAALVVLSVGAAGMLIGIPNASQSQAAASANAPENPLEPRPAAPAATATSIAGAESPERCSGWTCAAVTGRAPAVAGGRRRQPVGLRASATSVHAEDIKTADPHGYVVQVAAVPDLQEARAVLEQLAEAGYLRT